MAMTQRNANHNQQQWSGIELPPIKSLLGGQH